MLWIAMEELVNIHNGLLKLRDPRADTIVPIITDMLADVQAEILRCMLLTPDEGLALSH